MLQLRYVRARTALRDYIRSRPCQHRLFSNGYLGPVHVHDEIRHALFTNQPVVALESTIITHGMPRPQNLNTAIEVERIVRQNGAVPATIAVLDGMLRVGLDNNELSRLSEANAIKVSRRDLPVVLSDPNGRGRVGSTTVSATMVAAHAAGIRLFATGGIGGVHRDSVGSIPSMDVSADLTELARTPVSVVCAGVKSILDIARTLEQLETFGVPVVTLGSDEFPAFYVPSSGVKSVYNLPTVTDCARMIKSTMDLGLTNGTVIAVPIPPADVKIDGVALNAAIDSAVEEAKQKGIIGKDITPFLLDRIKSITEGKSLESNIALIKNNAKVAAEIAVCLAAMTPSKLFSVATSIPRPNIALDNGKRPFIIGGTVVDITAQTSGELLSKTSAPGNVYLTFGGVARNIAEACYRTGGCPIFQSKVGADSFGSMALADLKHTGLDVSRVAIACGMNTAVYNALLESNGELSAAVADMDIFESIHTPLIDMETVSVIAFDGNVSLTVMQKIAEALNKRPTIAAVFDPTSIPKANKIFSITSHEALGAVIITPNFDELFCMHARAVELGFIPPLNEVTVETASKNLSAIFGIVVAKIGKEGVVLARKGEVIRIMPPQIIEDVTSVTGAGDTLVGTLVTGLSKRSHDGRAVMNDLKYLRWCIEAGMRASIKSLMSKRPVAETLDSSIFIA